VASRRTARRAGRHAYGTRPCLASGARHLAHDTVAPQSGCSPPPPSRAKNAISRFALHTHLWLPLGGARVAPVGVCSRMPPGCALECLPGVAARVAPGKAGICPGKPFPGFFPDSGGRSRISNTNIREIRPGGVRATSSTAATKEVHGAPAAAAVLGTFLVLTQVYERRQR